MISFKPCIHSDKRIESIITNLQDNISYYLNDILPSKDKDNFQYVEYLTHYEENSITRIDKRTIHYDSFYDTTISQDKRYRKSVDISYDLAKYDYAGIEYFLKFAGRDGSKHFNIEIYKQDINGDFDNSVILRVLEMNHSLYKRDKSIADDLTSLIQDVVLTTIEYLNKNIFA